MARKKSAGFRLLSHFIGSVLFIFLFTLSERGKFLENFTYADEEMADVFEDTFYNTSFLGVTVFTNIIFSSE